MRGTRRPLKSLGQNFLVDQNVISRIINAADINEKDAVLEIGPGRGALTEHLVQKAGNLVLVEYDHALAAWHGENFQKQTNVKVVDADILAIDLKEVLGSEPGKWKVVANLPYNISTPVLFRLLEYRSLFSKMVLMFQKEVGERLVAAPDCSDYGVTTVLLGLWFDMRRELLVSAGSFHPRPKVDSAVISFIPLLKPRADVGDEELFRRVVKAAFGMRRKTLSNCLKAAELINKEEVDHLLEECKIDGRRRGETLSLEEFACLSRALNSR